MKATHLAFVSCLLLGSLEAQSQGAYEIQVYASPVMPKGATIVELHSNYTIKGNKLVIEGVRPTYKALNETIEVTTGVLKNYEMGFYLYQSIPDSGGYTVVGVNFRHRVQVPDSWNWPVGVSLSAEVGYQKRDYNISPWNGEIRPIVDKQIKNLYLALNPTLELSFQNNDEKGEAVQFAPNFKAYYLLTQVIGIGFETYHNFGPVFNWSSSELQEHQIFATVDLFWSPLWEFNVGLGWGLNDNTDPLVAKLILGRRFGLKR